MVRPVETGVSSGGAERRRSRLRTAIAGRPSPGSPRDRRASAKVPAPDRTSRATDAALRFDSPRACDASDSAAAPNWTYMEKSSVPAKGNGRELLTSTSFPIGIRPLGLTAPAEPTILTPVTSGSVFAAAGTLPSP